jgi:iron(III) transport system substrate-binding protein
MSMPSIKLTTLGLFIGFFFQVLINGQVHAASDAARPEAVKTEGKVVWWTTVPIDQSKVLADQFQKQFPFVEVDLFRTGVTSLQNKIVTEARVGRHSWDIANFNGEFVLELLKQKLIAPYVSPQQAMLEDDFKPRPNG